MTVFDLKKHGLAIALETPSGAVYFIDTGKKQNGEDSGRDVLAPFLKQRGIQDVAGILISHPHHDHFTGAAYLFKHFHVKSLLDSGLEGALVPEDYVKFRARCSEYGAELRSVRAGDTLTWDASLEISVLAPAKGWVSSNDDDFLNDNSIVLRIRHGDNVFLLPGDIQQRGRDSLLASVPPERLRATVLIAPHHGFFDAHRFIHVVKPQTVVVSCLADYPDKKIRSPGQHVTDLFGPLGSKVYVTAWDGSVEIESDGSACNVKTGRERKKDGSGD